MFRKRAKITIPRYEYDFVAGSRKVIKDPNNPRQNHYYKDDIWTHYGKKIAELLPEGTIIYGELVGWTPGPDAVPIQKGYTYHLPRGEAELYVYRVSQINAQGFLTDLPWDGVKEFCLSRGLKCVPELMRLPIWLLDDPTSSVDDLWERIADSRYADGMSNSWDDWEGWTENPLPLSDKKTVDEGICLRQEGLVPIILKLKSAKFLEHETKLLDKGEVDLESAA